MVVIKESHFDNYFNPKAGKQISIRRFTIENANQVSVQVITYGATITSIKYPDKRGVSKDVVAGFSNMAGYLQRNNPRFGATIGRSANYIGLAHFKCVDEEVKLTKNAGRHHFNGGFVGFDRVVWNSYVEDDMLVLSYNSPHQQEGYPGNLVVHAIFELTESNILTVHYKARSTKATYVNLTNYTYFNLGGFFGGPAILQKHSLCLHADKIIVKDKEGIPTGDLEPVVATACDFQIPKTMGSAINKVVDCDGFDHHLAITKNLDKDNKFVGRLFYPENGRAIEIFSNHPAVHLCTGNKLPEPRNPDKKYTGDVRVVSGKGFNYYKHGGLCVAPQHFPDSPNNNNFPDSLLIPGEDYYAFIAYKFMVKK